MGKLTQSYVHGASDLALIGDTIGVHLDRMAALSPGRPALIARQQGIRWRYGEFRDRVDELAAGLLGLGLMPGDRLGIWSPNNAEWVLTQFASAKAGLILVNINPAYRLHELDYALNKVGCRGLILASSFKTSDYIAMIRGLCPELDQARPGLLESRKVPSLRWVIRLGSDKTAGMLNFAEIAAAATSESRRRLAELAAELQFDDPINIQFTSGTTGNPKGATLTHHNILNNGFFIGEAMRLSEQDRLCIPVPFYHCFGMVLGNLACLTHRSCMVVPGEGFDPLAVLASVSTGAAMVFPGEAFDPVAALSAVAEERCTALHGVPTMFIAELGHPRFDEFDLRSLRTGIMAGSPCPIETMKQVVSRMHMREVTIAYGMTETSPVSFQSSTSDPLDRRTTTVGRVQPHLECKVIDLDGNVVPVGAKGELCTKGYSVMTGYWGDEERTRQAVVDGWMHTGDLATIDAEGYCNIVGRVKDMLIRGGENVYPREVEEFLF
ncbi:MAG TPA: AMP-binding protein, partial [Verrucomicrobiae bacterium]|nr:AMP-binding protein [Verrucomicrobiae bacterium]